MSEVTKYTRKEVSQHKMKNNLWIIIHNSVYDVSTFITMHPGGEEVLMELAGKNGTECFEDVGHSSEARELMKNYKIGELVTE